MNACERVVECETGSMHVTESSGSNRCQRKTCGRQYCVREDRSVCVCDDVV